MTEPVCGIDEAGRGPGAGPVVAAAVILPIGFDVSGLNDSKRLSHKKREALFEQITGHCCWAVGIAEPEEIDRINVLQATMAAMQRAVLHLPLQPARAIIDGNKIPANLPCPAKAIIGGDALEPAISAASIIAKVTRDRLMLEADRRFPEFGFARHKGYLTKDHKAALLAHGPCPIHRFSYAPVQEAARSYLAELV